MTPEASAAVRVSWRDTFDVWPYGHNPGFFPLERVVNV